MEIFPEQYYHLYNRSNNSEVIFKSRKAYRVFLKKYRKYAEEFVDTIGFCLMPTHFHFLVYTKSPEVEKLKQNIGILLSSYTKTMNLVHRRHGSMFQRHTKAKHVDDDDYLVTLLTYIHQNPVRAGFVKKLDDWEFSSYRLYTDQDPAEDPDLPLIRRDVITSHFSSIAEFEAYSNAVLETVKKDYWV
ncbi:MAG: transposase [Ignavibacteriales bacterium]|nr:transposase [Ignavibacteriales bacterium]